MQVSLVMKKLLVLIPIMIHLSLNSQITPEKIKQVFTNNISILSLQNSNEKLVERFYELNGYRLMWMRDEDRVLRNSLLKLLSSASDYGLNEKDYQFEYVQFLSGNRVLSTAPDTILADIRLTFAAIQFLAEVKNGNRPPVLSYTGISYEPNNMPVVLVLAEYCSKHNLVEITSKIESTSKEYINAKNLLLKFNKIMQDESFSEVVIKSNKVENSNAPLLLKLLQLGIIDSMQVTDQKVLIQKVQKVQKMFNLLNDGVLRSTTMNELNMPLWRRREELKNALNIIRWVEGIKRDSKVGIINIPSANLFVYSNDTVLLYSRLVVGKPSTPTFTLSSKITEVIAYPYWNVPYKIATKELLPSIRRNIRYLDDNNFQVLDKQGKVLDPYKISWQNLSASNFPYSIRQSTGCDNSLGLLKFNFYNPFTIYLHDTPFKGLFYLNKRYFSHGCMRLEKPVELAQMLLNEKASSIDSLTKQCLKEQKPLTIRLIEPMPLVVLYSTAWYNEKGEIQFFEDVYHKFSYEKPAIAKNQ
jgi:L,D-transpeptidase YcbB